MTISRLLAGTALATALLSIVPATAQAATAPATPQAAAGTTAAQGAGPWGTYYAPGRKAKANGSLTVSGEDHADIPAAERGRISGKVYDLTRGPSCGWAVFRLTYRTADGKNLPFKHRSIV